MAAIADPLQNLEVQFGKTITKGFLQRLFKSLDAQFTEAEIGALLASAPTNPSNPETLDTKVFLQWLSDTQPCCTPKQGTPTDESTHSDALPFLLPVTIDDVDAEIVTRVLRYKGYIEPSTRIVSLKKELFGREKGFMGDKCLLKSIAYEPPAPEAPDSIFVKMTPRELNMPARAVASRFRAEVLLMNCVLPEIPNFRVPKIYFAGANNCQEGAISFLILMEPVAGKPGSMYAGVPVAHAVAAARDIAAFHAPYWGWSRERVRGEATERGFKKFESLSHFEDEGKIAGTQDMWTKGTNAGIQLFGYESPLSAEQLQKFRRVVEYFRFIEADIWPLLQRRWVSYWARWRSIPMTLIHGDFHLENCFFHEDGANTYIDFQGASFDAGLRDLAYFIGSSMNPEDRLEHEKGIVRTYHEALVAQGVDYSWDQCWDDFVFLKGSSCFAGVVVGFFASSHFKAKSAYFAVKPKEDALLEAEKYNLCIGRICEDLCQSNWAAVLRALPEDPDA